MPCYHPLDAWRAPEFGKNGKLAITFRRKEGLDNIKLQLPCGRCTGCMLEKSRQWAVRCMHEAKRSSDNSFVTLTYDDDHLPANGSLVPRDHVLFMKRVRKWCSPKRVRFFNCGEYGSSTLRPHFHTLLFGVDFSDRVRLKRSSSGAYLYTSKLLDGLWSKGACFVGDVSFDSAGYVARYALKKVTGPKAAEHYCGRVPEYATMSRRPGLGLYHALEFMPEWYQRGYLVVNGSKCGFPRYYDDKARKLWPDFVQAVKIGRRREAADSPDNSGVRLSAREAVKEAAIVMLTRSYEDGNDS